MATTSRVFDNGTGATLNQPINQVAFVANLGAAPTGVEIATAVNALRDALVQAGVMKAV